MHFGKHIAVILVSFLLWGCATSGMMTVGNICNVASGKKGSTNKNPLIEAELDLTILDEVAAMVKMNQIILERMPISYEDNWPELLNDYYKSNLTEDEKKKKEAYDKSLEEKLKKDFSFYELYNVNSYAVSIVSTDNLFYSILGSLGSRIFIEGAKNLGLGLEHAKSVLSYVPFGCDGEYFSEEFVDKNLDKEMCNEVKNMECYQQCDFFNKPTEEMLIEYMSNKGGIKKWAEIPVEIECFRTVSGENLGTFNEVFYSLLHPDIMDKIKKIDTEIFLVESDLEEIKLKIKDEKFCSRLSNEEQKALKERKDKLEEELKSKKELQEKLYEEAVSKLYVTEENVKKAKKLKEIVDFIDRNFTENLTVILNLSIKIVNDVVIMSGMDIEHAFFTYPRLVSKGVFSKNDRSFYENRLKNIMEKIVTLPIASVEVLGYSIAQKNKVSQYKKYLEAMLEMEEKLKNK